MRHKLSPAPFSHSYLAPTLLHAIGVDSPDEFEGRSYWPEMQAGGGWDVAISEAVGKCTNPMNPEKRAGARVLAVQDEQYKLVVDFESCAEELYDLKADPQERHSLPQGAEIKVRARMLRQAHEHLARTNSNRTAALR